MIPSSWHEALQQHIIERYRLGNLPHAMLIHGHQGIGKLQAVLRVSQALLCQKPQGVMPCGQCQACQLFMQRTHPNFIHLAPEVNVEKKTQSPIKIDQIRDLSEKLVMTSQYSGPNIALIDQAHSMNLFAANALLKTLEEPTSNTLLLLVTHQPSQLLATIRSRCQAYLLSKPDENEALTWLQSQDDVDEKQALQSLAMADGAPLRALQFIQDKTNDSYNQFVQVLADLFQSQATIKQAAEQGMSMDFSLCVQCLQNILLDMLKLQQVNDNNTIKNKGMSKIIRQLSQTLALQQVYTLQDQLNSMLRTHNASINAQLMLESFLATWHNMFINHTKNT